MNTRRRSLLAAFVIGATLAGCGPGGDVAIPSDLGGLLEALASSIPNSSQAPEPDADVPGPAPATVAGTLTIQLDEEQGDAQLGMEIHTTFVADISLKASPETTQEDIASGLAEYVDDGSGWTFTGHSHGWSAGGAGGCASDDVMDWDDSGAFDEGSRYVTAATMGEGDFDWSFHLELSAEDAPGHGTQTICGDTETTETDAGGGYIFCDARFDSTYLFDFNENCDLQTDDGLTDVQGTLQGSR